MTQNRYRFLRTSAYYADWLAFSSGWRASLTSFRIPPWLKRSPSRSHSCVCAPRIFLSTLLRLPYVSTRVSRTDDRLPPDNDLAMEQGQFRGLRWHLLGVTDSWTFQCFQLFAIYKGSPIDQILLVVLTM